MRHIISAIFAAIIIANVTPTHGAGTQTLDPRQYVEWCTPEYDRIVAFFPPNPGGNNYYITPTCTAQYVAKDIIATALHCLERYSGDTFQISKCDNPSKRYDATVIARGDKNGTADWALLRITDPAGFSDRFFNISATTAPVNTTLTVTGWGSARIFSDQEISQFKAAIQKCRSENKCKTMNEMKSILEAAGLNFKEPTPDDYSKQLKTHKNCHTTRVYARTFIETTCHIYNGNSGGGAISGDTLYGVASRSMTNPVNLTYTSIFADSKTFVGNMATAQQSTPTTQSTGADSTATSSKTDSAAASSEDVTRAEMNDQIKQAESNATKTFDKISDTIGKNEKISDTDALALLTEMSQIDILREKIDKLIENADKMRAKEQSLENRLIGAAGIGATGYGLMNALSANAEQRADQTAEEDMRAYLATFTCEYGAGHRVRGGETNIQVSGGNDLTALVTQYKALAASLKERKEALGLKPGIESEEIIDIAETGLYDNVGLGRQSGAYASLSRALTDENSADAAAWAKQKADTASKLKTGAIIAGVGAAGSLIANLAVNNRESKKNQVNKILKDYEQKAGQAFNNKIDQVPEETITCPDGRTKVKMSQNCPCGANQYWAAEMGECLACAPGWTSDGINGCQCKGANKLQNASGDCVETTIDCPGDANKELIYANNDKCECKDEKYTYKQGEGCVSNAPPANNENNNANTEPEGPVSWNIPGRKFFTNGSHTVANAAQLQNALKAGADALKGADENMKCDFAFVGHTDTSGVKRRYDNQGLSERRAKAVLAEAQKVITSTNYPNFTLSDAIGKGYSECKCVDKTGPCAKLDTGVKLPDDKSYEPCRRVEIQVSCTSSASGLNVQQLKDTVQQVLNK